MAHLTSSLISDVARLDAKLAALRTQHQSAAATDGRLPWERIVAIGQEALGLEAEKKLAIVAIGQEALRLEVERKLAATAQARFQEATPLERLVMPYFVDQQGVIKRPERLIAWWKHRIFPYFGPSGELRLHLRRSCRLFRDSLPWGEAWRFPHPKYSTLNQLVNRINEEAQNDPSKAPSVVYVLNGVHDVEETGTRKNRRKYVEIRCSMTVVGESRGSTIVKGGFWIKGDKVKDHVKLKNMTVSHTKGCGVHGSNSAKFEGKELLINGCSEQGVLAYKTQGTLADCTVTNCGRSGIVSQGNGVIHMLGEKTNVTQNCTSGERGSYDLLALHSSSKIVLHAPLTKESVSGYNRFGRYWGGDGNIVELACA